MEFETAELANAFYKKVEEKYNEELQKNYTTEEIDNLGIIEKDILHQKVIDSLIQVHRPDAVYTFNPITREYQYDKDATIQVQKRYDKSRKQKGG